MGFPTTNQCCCGFKLRTGVMILGYIGVVGCILILLQVAISNWNKDNGSHNAGDQHIITPNAVYLLIHCIIAAGLLYGVYNKSRVAIRYVVSMQLGLSIGMASVRFAVAINHNMLFIIPIYVFALFIGYYFLWVAYSYAEELKEEMENAESPA